MNASGIRTVTPDAVARRRFSSTSNAFTRKRSREDDRSPRRDRSLVARLFSRDRVTSPARSQALTSTRVVARRASTTASGGVAAARVASLSSRMKRASFAHAFVVRLRARSHRVRSTSTRVVERVVERVELGALACASEGAWRPRARRRARRPMTAKTPTPDVERS